MRRRARRKLTTARKGGELIRRESRRSRHESGWAAIALYKPQTRQTSGSAVGPRCTGLRPIRGLNTPANRPVGAKCGSPAAHHPIPPDARGTKRGSTLPETETRSAPPLIASPVRRRRELWRRSVGRTHCDASLRGLARLEKDLQGYDYHADHEAGEYCEHERTSA